MNGKYIAFNLESTLTQISKKKAVSEIHSICFVGTLKVTWKLPISYLSSQQLYRVNQRMDLNLYVSDTSLQMWDRDQTTQAYQVSAEYACSHGSSLICLWPQTLRDQMCWWGRAPFALYKKKKEV